MQHYPILFHPHPHLRLVAKPVGSFDERLREISERMFATMYEAHGIGLAATQVMVNSNEFLYYVHQSLTRGSTFVIFAIMCIDVP